MESRNGLGHNASWLKIGNLVSRILEPNKKLWQGLIITLDDVFKTDG